MTHYLESKPRYEVLDGLRGVAAIIVVLFPIRVPSPIIILFPTYIALLSPMYTSLPMDNFPKTTM